MRHLGGVRVPAVGIMLAVVMVVPSCADEDADIQRAGRSKSEPVSAAPSPSTSPPPCSVAVPSMQAPPTSTVPGADVPADVAARVPDDLIGTEWSSLPTDKKVVALTFDAGSNADGVDQILETLSRKDAPATFFLTGHWVEVFPSDASRSPRATPSGTTRSTILI